MGGRSVHKLLDPPPPSFLRIPPPGTYFPPFAPLVVPSLGNRFLAKGFPAVLPATGPGVHPHPFSTHDVREGDWMHFLSDVKRAASLGWGDRVAAGAPHLIMPVLPGEQ